MIAFALFLVGMLLLACSIRLHQSYRTRALILHRLAVACRRLA